MIGAYYFRRIENGPQLWLSVAEFHPRKDGQKVPDKKMRASIELPFDRINDDTEATFLKSAFDLNGVPTLLYYVEGDIPQKRLLRFFAFIGHHNVKTVELPLAKEKTEVPHEG